MTAKHLLLGLIEAMCWYGFFWYLLYAIRRPEQKLWRPALVLLVLFYLAFITCPWVRHTQAFNEL